MHAHALLEMEMAGRRRLAVNNRTRASELSVLGAALVRSVYPHDA